MREARLGKGVTDDIFVNDRTLREAAKLRGEMHAALWRAAGRAAAALASAIARRIRVATRHIRGIV